MSLTEQQLNELMRIGKQACLAAGTIIEKYQGAAVTTELKSGGTSIASKILTKVDGEAEQAILDILLPTLETYSLGILSEETEDDKSRFNRDYFWCIDPLDGTLAFTQNIPGYSTSIALVTKSGEALLGIVYDPRESNCYSAIKGQGAYKNDNNLIAKANDNNKEVTIISEPGGAVMLAITTLESPPSLFYKKPKPQQGGGCLWDYAATTLIHSEAGGRNSSFNFTPINLNSSESVYMNKQGVIFSTGLTDHEIQSFL